MLPNKTLEVSKAGRLIAAPGYPGKGKGCLKTNRKVVQRRAERRGSEICKGSGRILKKCGENEEWHIHRSW